MRRVSRPNSRPYVRPKMEAALEKVTNGELEQFPRVLRWLGVSDCARGGAMPTPTRLVIDDALSTSAMLTAPSTVQVASFAFASTVWSGVRRRVRVVARNYVSVWSLCSSNARQMPNDIPFMTGISSIDREAQPLRDLVRGVSVQSGIRASFRVKFAHVSRKSRKDSGLTGRKHMIGRVTVCYCIRCCAIIHVSEREIVADKNAKSASPMFSC